MPKVSSQSPSINIKVCVLGTRGFPNVPGGIESHCEHLYPEFAKFGCTIIIFTRKPYCTPESGIYRGVKLLALSCPKNKYFEAIIHTFKGIFFARKFNPNILHIHAIGPALLTPLSRLLGMKVVFTHHGPDYHRVKWGVFAKFILKIGEWAGVTFSHQVITITDGIAADLRKRFSRNNIIAIPNGVDISEQATTDECLKDFSLEKNKYILSVGRFVPEKGFHYLIDAFEKMRNTRCGVKKKQSTAVWQQPTVSNIKAQYPNLSGSASQLSTKNWKLVIVGDADHEDKYSRELKDKAYRSSNTILTGFLTGKPLKELYSNAGLFVLPSCYEGLPIALLEAMSCGLSCIVSDIPANRNVGLSDDRYFKSGDVEALAIKLKEYAGKPFTDAEKNKQISRIAEKYNWENIAKRTLEVYKAAVRS